MNKECTLPNRLDIFWISKELACRTNSQCHAANGYRLCLHHGPPCLYRGTPAAMSTAQARVLPHIAPRITDQIF